MSKRFDLVLDLCNLGWSARVTLLAKDESCITHL